MDFRVDRRTSKFKYRLSDDESALILQSLRDMRRLAANRPMNHPLDVVAARFNMEVCQLCSQLVGMSINAEDPSIELIGECDDYVRFICRTLETGKSKVGVFRLVVPVSARIILAQHARQRSFPQPERSLLEAWAFGELR